MKAYESIFIVKPQMDDASLNELINKYEALIIKNEGTILKKENWGLKTMAYEIRRNRQGFYIQFHFQAPETIVRTLENSYRIDENIIRYITVCLTNSESAQYQINQ